MRSHFLMRCLLLSSLVGVTHAQVPMAGGNPALPPKPDCRSHPHQPGCNPPHRDQHRILYLKEADNRSEQQGNASYLYVAAQQKACAQANAPSQLNPYCVARFADCILQHCGNFTPDSATAPLCKAALDIALQKNPP